MRRLDDDAKTVAPVICIRRIRPGEGHRLRDLRLQALTDDPRAFGDALEAEEAHSQSHWELAASRAAISNSVATFIAEDRAVWYGLQTAVSAELEQGAAWLVHLWVHPARRRLGLGGALIDTAVAWLKERGFRRAFAWVAEPNLQSRSVLASRGFVETSRYKPMPSDTTVRLIFMIRELGQESSCVPDDAIAIKSQ